MNRGNGYRERPFDARAGTIALAVPKLKQRQLLPRLATRSAADGLKEPWSP